MKTHKNWLLIATTFLIVAVVLGAFGAHALTSIWAEEQLQSFETAVRYQFYGAFTILFFVTIGELKRINLKRGLRLLGLGTFLFSFSIYGLLMFKTLKLPYLIFVPLTPIGGALLIVGLTVLGLKIYKSWNEFE